MSNPAMMAGPAAVSGLEEPSAKRPRRSGIAHDQVRVDIVIRNGILYFVSFVWSDLG